MSRLARVGKALGFRQVPRQGTMVISGCRVEGKSNSHPQVVSRCGGGNRLPTVWCQILLWFIVTVHSSESSFHNAVKLQVNFIHLGGIFLITDNRKSAFLLVGTLPAKDPGSETDPWGLFQVCAATWSAELAVTEGLSSPVLPGVGFPLVVFFLIKAWPGQGVKVASCVGLGWLGWQTTSFSTYCSAHPGSRAGFKTIYTWNEFGAARIDQSRKREMSKEEGMGNRLMCLWREEKECVKQTQEQ